MKLELIPDGCIVGIKVELLPLRKCHSDAESMVFPYLKSGEDRGHRLVRIHRAEDGFTITR